MKPYFSQLVSIRINSITPLLPPFFCGSTAQYLACLPQYNIAFVCFKVLTHRIFLKASFTASSHLLLCVLTVILSEVFLQALTHDALWREVVSPSPHPQPGWPGLHMYDPHRQAGPAIPVGTGQLGTLGVPLPILPLLDRCMSPHLLFCLHSL